MNLTLPQIEKMAQAINLLDRQHVLELVDGKLVNVWRGFKLAPALRILLARAQNEFLGALAAFQKANDALINQYSEGLGEISPGSAKWVEYVRELAALKQTAIEMRLETFTIADLQMDFNEALGNGLPIAVLAALQPLIRPPESGK